MDEHEVIGLIERLQQYSGAPMVVPSSDVDGVQLPKPRLERDSGASGTARLSFEPHGVPDLWADVFNREAGGRAWPPGLPIPRIEDGRIDIASLPVGDVRNYVEAIREYFAATNHAVARQLPELEARRREAEATARRLDEELEEAQRFLDKQFGPSGA